MQNQQDQLQRPLPPGAPTTMDANEESVRSFSQLLKRGEIDGDDDEPRDSVQNGKTLDEEEEEEVAMPAVIRQDSIASRASQKNPLVAKPRVKDPILKVTVALLFLLIVCGISVIYHFHKLEIHMLRLSHKIQLNEDNRVLTIERNATYKALIGRLGMHLPDYEWPYDCSDYDSSEYQTHKCLRWKNRAQLKILYESRNINDSMAECHSIHWQDLSDFDHSDCYLLDGASWIGGGLLWEQDFPSSQNDVDALHFITTVSPEEGGAGQILEPFWISTRGISIFVDRQIPLSVSVSNLTFHKSQMRRFRHIAAPPNGRYMCLNPHITPEHRLKFGNETKWLNYTVCVGSNMKTVQQYAMKHKVPKLRPLKDKSVFLKPVFTATHLSPDFTQDDITTFAKTLHDAGYNGILMINPGWEMNPGDFIFHPTRFPNVTEMMRILRSYNFTVNLPVHPYVGVHSSNFGPHSDNGLFMMDGAGKNPGLTRWNCHNCEEAIVAVMDLSYPDAVQDLQNRIRHMMDTVKPDSLSFYGGDASSLPFMAYQSDPQINSYTETFGAFAANITDTVFLQSAFSAQDVNPFLMMPCDNSTWSSLRILLKRVLTLGLIGYPNMVQGPIGGCDVSSISEELYIRWLQLGTFFPLLHFAGAPSNMSARASKIATDMVRLHNTKVVPLILELLNDTEHNSPLVRPMWWFQPKSSFAFNSVDQFMVGDDIVVAPVLCQQTTARNVYLPRGHWRDGWNETMIHIGPKILKNYRVPLDRVPFFKYKRSNKT